MSFTPEICETLLQKLGDNHIMLSYNWGVQDLVVAVYEYIESKGLPVWMDVKGGVSGNINAAMAKGVENAMVICPFMTEAYQSSEACELELNYAKDRKVQIVPVMVQERAESGSEYRASGWLGVITAGKLWLDFRGVEGDAIATKTEALLLEIANKLNVDVSGGFKAAKKPSPPKPAAAPAPPPAAPAPAPAPAPVPAPAPPPPPPPAASPGPSGIRIKGCHGHHLKPSPNDNSPYTMEKIRGEIVALKSSSGKYLSAQPNGTLQWNRDRAQAWEHFTIKHHGGGKISLKSHHKKFVSAQANGTWEANRDKCLGWEQFWIENVAGSAPAPSGPVPSGGELKNLALRKPCWQSSVACGGKPERAVDGNTDGVYNHGGVTHTDPGADAKNMGGVGWWHCELGGWYKVRTVRVWNRIECEDRIDWAAVILNKKKIGNIRHVKGKQMYEFPAGDYCTKSVTVALVTGKPLSLAQVEVFGTGETGPALTDVALKKPCKQSSVVCGGEPNRAVNGNENNIYDSGNTTHTDPKKDNKNAWWFVDLQGQYFINEINILNRRECAERINQANVFVDSELVHTIQFAKDKWWYHIPLPRKVGSRVGVTLTTGAPLSMCEVIVLSEGKA